MVARLVGGGTIFAKKHTPQVRIPGLSKTENERHSFKNVFGNPAYRE
ncbi:hypothetical protein [Methanolobus psychrotolerans]|nr:hypothetical protein [Methanolobus psychrotolerans]